LSAEVTESRAPGRSPWHPRVAPLATAVGLAAIGGSLFWLSWGHWPDVLVDFGRELYLAWRVAEGDVLYRDLRHFSGPLSVYWNAAVFRIFGTGLLSLVWANALLLALLTFVLYRLLLGIAGPLTAFVGPAVMLGGFAFGQFHRIGNYNYVTPYAHEITHGLLLSLACLVVLGARERLGERSYALGGLLLGAVALTKAEVWVAAVAGVGVLLALQLRRDRAGDALDARTLSRRAGLFALGCALPAVAAWLWLARSLPLAEAASALADPWRFALDDRVRALPFYRRSMGTLAPLESLARVLRFGAGWALLFGLAVLAAMRAPLSTRAARWLAAAIGLLVCVGLGPVLGVDWVWVTTPLPAFFAVWLAIAGVGQLRRPSLGAGAASDALRLAFVAFAIVLTAKIALRAGVVHYGFALAMPIALLGVAAVCDWIPRWVEARGGRGVWVRAVGLGAIAALLLASTQATLRSHARHRHPVGLGADAFLADMRGFHVAALLAQLRQLPADATLLVLPEGVMINYLARRRNPTPYLNFMPPELILFGEGAILNAFERQPPDYVALVHKSTREYGFPFFGRDYGVSLRAFVDRHYRLVSRIGEEPLSPDSDFGITLHRRVRGR
jgi:hypothetical protein